jgi:hypothetical protein
MIVASQSPASEGARLEHEAATSAAMSTTDRANMTEFSRKSTNYPEAEPSEHGAHDLG